MFRKILCSGSNVSKLSSRGCCCVCYPSAVNYTSRLSVLGNGVRVATEVGPSPMAAVALFIEAGSRFETACNNGITNFIEHMAYKGYEDMTRSQLEDLLRSMGAKMTAFTSREVQAFSAICPTECVKTVVGLLANVITNIALNEDQMKMEKENMQLELLDADNDPKRVLFDYLHATAFQGTPLAKSVIGRSENIIRFDKPLINSFLCEHYQPYKLALVGVGNIAHEDLACYAETKFGHMCGDPSCESEEGPTRFTGSQVIYRDDSMPFAHVAIAFEVPGYNSAEYMTLMTAKEIIGTWSKNQGLSTFSAWPLARKVALEDLSEYYESFYIPYRDVGLWGIYFVSRKMDVEDMLYNVQDAWMNMCVTTYKSEVDRAVNNLKMHFAKISDSSVRSCHDLGMQTLYTCGRKGLEDFYLELRGQKEITIRQTMDKYLYDRCPAVAAIGPVEGLPEYTRIRAGQYWLRA